MPRKFKAVVIASALSVVWSGAALAAPVNNFGPKRTGDRAVVGEGAAGAVGREGASRLTHIPPAAESFPSGEKLEYRINWWGIEIGTTEILITETEAENGGGSEYRIDAKARDNEYLRKIFPVEDAFGSRMTAEGHSLIFERNVKEGKYRAHEITTLNYADGLARRVSETDGSVTESPITGPVHDALTAFYWARRQPLEIGGTASARIFLKEKTWDLSVHAREIKSFSLPGQPDRDVVVLVPEVRLEGDVVKRAKARIYVTADERRVPLLIRLDTPYGPVTGILKTPLP